MSCLTYELQMCRRRKKNQYLFVGCVDFQSCSCVAQCTTAHTHTLLQQEVWSVPDKTQHPVLLLLLLLGLLCFAVCCSHAARRLVMSLRDAALGRPGS